MSRILAGALALLFGLNGLVMIFASFWWYGAVPGVTATGAYNPHFVRDIGAVFLVMSASLSWSIWRPVQGWSALVMTALFLVLHAAVHVFDAACSSTPMADAIRDTPAVFLPAAISVWLAFARRPRG